jgi:lipid II:glycine glycyltransferase (peptidoglycan interpeptide bridge formation enzyme)
LEAVKEKIDLKPDYFFEIKGWEELISPGEIGFVESCQYLQHVSLLKDCPAGLRAELDKNYHLKRNLKKAERANLTIRDADGDDDLKRFSQLSIKTRRRIKLFPWPSRYIKSIYKHVIAAGYGFLLLAESDGTVVAGSLYLCFKDRVTLKINASDKHYAKLRANYLITIKAMERACYAGYKHFDFGISHLDNSGLIAFKKQWGSNESQISYYTYFGDKSGMDPRAKPSYRKVYNLINKITPAFIVKIASNILYRHSG